MPPVAGPVRWAIIVLLAWAVPSIARADAYAWGGSAGGLEVRVVLAGFRDGAGTSGWTEEGARRFARRAAEVAALTGPGVRLEEAVENEDGLTLVFGARRTPLGLRDFEGSDAQWDHVVRAVRALGLAPRAARVRAVRVYTIELAPGSCTDVDDPPGQLFYEACLPCAAAPSTHALGASRRVIGVFDGPAAAQRALRSLRARGVRGRAVPL